MSDNQGAIIYPVNFANVLKGFNDSEARDANGRWVQGGSGGAATATSPYDDNQVIFGTSNRLPRANIKDALAQMSTKLGQYENNVDAVNKKYGFQGTHERTLGFWEGNFEGAVANHVHLKSGGAIDQDVLKSAASELGKAHHQDAMVTFTYAKDGPHSLYDMDVPTDLETTGKAIKQLGIQAANLVPGPRGTTHVRIADETNNHDRVANLAIALHATDIDYHSGESHLIWKADYDKNIAAHTQRQQQRAKTAREQTTRKHQGHSLSREVGRARWSGFHHGIHRKQAGEVVAMRKRIEGLP